MSKRFDEASNELLTLRSGLPGRDERLDSSIPRKLALLARFTISRPRLNRDRLPESEPPERLVCRLTGGPITI